MQLLNLGPISYLRIADAIVDASLCRHCRSVILLKPHNMLMGSSAAKQLRIREVMSFPTTTEVVSRSI